MADSTVGLVLCSHSEISQDGHASTSKHNEAYDGLPFQEVPPRSVNPA